ncbi:cytochrome C oxidase subunit IV family protein [Larkinella soli]|uniref:cytochrome C oxidase subunit IV family protein n=1 Tax=Larkinella soli TaxID=1770527 RepID=UPI000FFB3AB1|nr:cytochrome C oxidase subunit IV family protein [Larkinella soli]
MAEHTSHPHDSEHHEIPEPQTKAIWRTFIILSVVTGFEFLIAFIMNASPLKTAIFVGMTIVKAFYIVGEFMHLKHEVKSLIWSIVLPCIFVVWLLVALLMEGGSIFMLR